MKYLNILILAFVITVVSNVDLQAQCCKCFSTPANCSTECHHPSGREWCGCDTGCQCGASCGSGPGGKVDVIFLNSGDDLDNILAPISIPSTGILVKITDSKVIDQAFNVGFTFGSRNENTLINDSYGLYHLGNGFYRLFRKEDDEKFIVRGCDDSALFKVTASL